MKITNLVRRPACTAHVLLAFAIVTIAGAAGAEDQILDIRTTVDLAARGNTDLRREKITIRITQANLLTASGQFDFDLSAGLTFRQQAVPSVAAMDIASGVTSTLTPSIGLGRSLETGGHVQLTFNGSAVNSTSQFVCDTTPCTVYSSNFSLRFDHPLLRGFGSEIALATIRRRKIEGDMALLNRQTRVSNVLRDILTGYWELAYASRDLEIRNAAVALARKQLEMTNSQIEVGRLAAIDRAAVERAISDRMQEVVLSEQTMLFRGLQMRRLFGLPVEPSLSSYVAADAPAATPHEVDVAAELTRTLQVNPQLRSLRMGMALTEIDVATARSTLKPQLDMFAQVGTAGRNPSLSETLSQVTGSKNLTWSTGLVFGMPLQNRTARGQFEAARLGQDLSWLDATSLELDLRDQVVRLAANIKNSGRRIELAQNTVKFAERSLEAEEARFSVGRSTNNDVLLRQQELKLAQIQVIRATVDLLTAEIALDAMTGELLDRYGVVLTGS